MALLPPSSRTARLRLAAQTVATCRPTLSEPVKEMTCGTGCSSRVSPISAMSVTTTLSSPAGSPASSKTLASRVPPQIGVFWCGLRTNRVAEGEGGGDGLEGEQEGEVEGADDPDDPDRHPVDAVLLALGGRGEDLPGRAQGELDGLAQELLGQVQFEGGLQVGAAQLRDDGPGDLRFALLDDPQRLLQDRTPGVRSWRRRCGSSRSANRRSPGPSSRSWAAPT